MARSRNGPKREEEERVYLEIELDEATIREIEEVAALHEVTPFGLCVELLREAVDKRTRLDG